MSRRPQNGFSLIELMIAVAIVAIVTALAFPSYRAWIQNTRIRNTAESILNGLQIARAEAVKRNINVQFALGADSDWTVGCVPPVTAQCPDAVIQSRSTGEGSSSSITVITNPAANRTVAFTFLGMVATAPVPFTQVDVNVPASVLADARNLRITLGTGGNARMCDPNPSLPSTDPRKC